MAVYCKLLDQAEARIVAGKNGVISSGMVCMLQEGEHFLGMFNQESAAARACDVAALKLHGSSATTNFPARYCCAVEVMPSDLTAARLQLEHALLCCIMPNRIFWSKLHHGNEQLTCFDQMACVT